jgi:F-type H+-transporting ATPase subunit b
MGLPLLLASDFTEIRPGLIFWTIITFLVVALVLRARVWKPVLNVVEEREKQISNAIESAKRERAEAEKLLAEQKTAIAEARREAAEMMRKNTAEMEKFRDELMAKARADAEAAKAEAARNIEDLKAKAVAELKQQATHLAIQIAEKLISKTLDDTLHRKLAEDFMAQLPSDKGGRATSSP